MTHGLVQEVFGEYMSIVYSQCWNHCDNSSTDERILVLLESKYEFGSVDERVSHELDQTKLYQCLNDVELSLQSIPFLHATKVHGKPIGSRVSHRRCQL